MFYCKPEADAIKRTSKPCSFPKRKKVLRNKLTYKQIDYLYKEHVSKKCQIKHARKTRGKRRQKLTSLTYFLCLGKMSTCE